jgi:yecA family protein
MLRSAKSRLKLYAETPLLLPPKLNEFGHRLFTSREREKLTYWLREPAWPRDTLNIHALEGYLTALLVWPVALQPGAWLPPIWNEEGWRVRAPIDSVDRYGEFLELVVGLLRVIDQSLLQSPPTFELNIGRDRPSMSACAQHWAQGFGRGLRQAVQSRVAPTPETREAIRTIAACAAGQSSNSRSGTRQADIVLTHAVLVLAKTRVSRGPLGALPKQTITAEPTDPKIQPHAEAGAPKDGLT